MATAQELLTQAIGNTDNLAAKKLLKEGASSLSVPDNVGDVSPTGSVTFPNVGPTLGNVDNASATSASAQSQIESLIQGETQRREDTIAQRDTQNKSFLQSVLKQAPDRAGTREELSKDLGLTELRENLEADTATLDALSKQHNDARAVMEEEVAEARRNEGGAFGQRAVENAVLAAERKHAPRLNRLSKDINTQAAIIEMRRGNIDQAQQFISQAVNDAVAEQQFVVDTMFAFQDANAKLFDDMDDVYSDAFSARLSFLSDELSEARLRARTSLEDGLGIPSSEGFANSEVEISVREDAVELLAENSAEAAFATLRIKYSPQEVSDAALKSLLGLEDAGATAEEGGGAVFGGLPQPVGGQSTASFLGQGFKSGISQVGGGLLRGFNTVTNPITTAVQNRGAVTQNQSVEDFFGSLFSD